MNGRGNDTDIQVYCQLALLFYHDRPTYFWRKEVNLDCAQGPAGISGDAEGSARKHWEKQPLCPRKTPIPQKQIFHHRVRREDPEGERVMANIPSRCAASQRRRANIILLT